MTEAYFLKRQDRLKNVLAEQNLDGLFITNLTNVRYLSGFTGSAGACLFTPNGQYFFTDGRYIEMSRQQVKGFERFISSDPHLKNIKTNDLIKGDLKLGFEGDFVSVNQFGEMKDTFSQVNWQSTTRIVEELAAFKDASEIEAFRTAVEITDRTHEEILPLIKEGVTEKFIANELLKRYREYGDGEAFAPIVAGGPNSALPHAVPSDRPFQKGDFIVIDAAAKYAGYHADMTRTPVLGKPTEKHKEIYAIVKEAQQAGIDAVRDGISCKDVDSSTRDIIERHGYGDLYTHGTGHGLGLEIHTMPRMSQISEDTLYENYVVTIEPGIYEVGWGGVRIEDDIIVRKDHGEVLNKSSKDLLAL
ncbi:MAG: aminopeptidase P family protein [Candidatus Marinimicrobia bacterium]|nr:aminopeptidase P family protein [Candidatus Neomarinimicrobiota bacterium]